MRSCTSHDSPRLSFPKNKEKDMAKKITDKDIFTRPVSEMTEAERLRAIERLELLRDEVMLQLEGVMEEVSAESGVASYSKRKHKFGEAPNDN